MEKKDFTGLAKDRFPLAECINGNGRWATLAWCKDCRVHLHETKSKAIKALVAIDFMGCGGCCRGNHMLIDLGNCKNAWYLPFRNTKVYAKEVAKNGFNKR